jgi:hypothetical protein
MVANKGRDTPCTECLGVNCVSVGGAAAPPYRGKFDKDGQGQPSLPEAPADDSVGGACAVPAHFVFGIG